MQDVARRNLKGVGYALVAFAIYSAHDVVVKTLGASYATFQIVFFSTLLSFPLVLLMLMRDQTEGTLIPRHPWWITLRTLATLVTAVCVFYAFSTLPLAQVYAIIFTMPLLITVLSVPVLGEKVGLHRWAAVAVGLTGVLVVLRPGAEALTLGHMAALAGAVTGALSAVIVRRIGQEERSAVLLLYPMMANFAVMAAAMPFFYAPMPVEHLGLVGVMALMAFVGGILTIRAYTAGDAAIVAPMQYSQMLWAAFYGSFFFGEMPDRMTWIGAGIIIASGVYVVLRESFGGRSDFSPVLRTRSRAETGTTPRISALLRLSRRSGQPPH